MFANLDVTTHALSWNILRISQHEAIQQKLYSEIQANLGLRTVGEDHEDYVRREDTLLAACILETSRLHPILRQ